MNLGQKRICLLFGGNKLNAGVAEKFRHWGCDTIVVDWNEKPAIAGDLHLRLDVKEPQPILDELKKRDLLGRIAFGYTSIDVAVPSLAFVLKTCGLQVNSEEGLSNSFSKSRQTALWQKAGLLNRESRKVANDDSLARECDEIFASNQHQKLIVKPDNAASSRGITILERGSAETDVELALHKAFENAGNGLAVVEEFVEGTEFTVEMLGDGVGHVSVYAISKKQHTRNTDRNRIAVKLHYNAIPQDLAQRIADAGMKCYKALGFRSSLGHLEVILKGDGTISPVEIGARSSGYIASHLVDIASGRDFLGDLREVYNGGVVEDGLREQSANSSMYYFYDLPAGSKIVHPCSLLDFCDKTIISHASDRAEMVQGRLIGKIDNDNARIGFEILEGPKAVMTEAYVADAEKRMLAAMLSLPK